MVAAEKPFIDAICAAPDDDAPRLAFSDWLLERGDPRGLLVSVQCALGREAAWPAVRKLLAQQNLLLRKHAAKWTAGARAAHEGTFTFRRGFIEHVAPAGRDSLEEALPKLREAAPLLRAFSVADRLVPQLQRAAFVEELELDGWPDLAAVCLALEHGVPKLRRLVIDRCAEHFTGELEALAALRQPLDELSLGFHPLMSTEAQRDALFAGLARRKRLRVLRVRQLRRAGAIAVRGLEQLQLENADVELPQLYALAKGLTSLDVSQNDKRGTKELNLGELLAAAPKLTALRLSAMWLGDAQAAALAESPHAARLRSLDLSRNHIQDGGARALVESEHLGGLRSLNLNLNPLSTQMRRQLKSRFRDLRLEVK